MIRRVVVLILTLQLFAFPSLAQDESCDPDGNYEGYLDIATDYFYDSAFTEAEDALNCALALNPDEPEIYRQLALVHLYMFDIDNALLDAQMRVLLTENDPEQNIKALSLQANLFVYAGDDESALAILQSVLDDLPEDDNIYKDTISNVYLSVGRIYVHLTQPEQAIENLDQSILYNTENAFAYFYRGIAYAQLENREKSQLDYVVAVELNPNLVTYFRNQGSIYSHLNRYDLAIPSPKNRRLKGL